MGRGSSPRTDVEKSKLKKIINENKQLKKELAALQKDLIRSQKEECLACGGIEKKPKKEKIKRVLEEVPESKPAPLHDRKCHKCETGQLIFIEYLRLNETYYFRKCDSCANRTRGKKLTPDVQRD